MANNRQPTEATGAPVEETQAPSPEVAAPTVPIIEWNTDSDAINPLAKWEGNIILVTGYRTENGADEVQVNGTDWIKPNKRYFVRVKGLMDAHGGSGKVHVRATVSKTEAGRYILK